MWSQKKAVITGSIIGGIFGILFFGAYGLIAAWICDGLRSCPAHWAPYVIFAVIGVGISIVLGAGTGALLRKLYQLFKVT